MITTALCRHVLAGLTAALLAVPGLALADGSTDKTETTKKEEAGSEASATGAAKGSTDAATESKYVIGDIPIGDANAPVTVIEYASFTCPYCATFHNTVWDEFKKNYIDTGKVRFILREVYFDKYGLWASMTARCAGPEGFYPMVDAYLKTQHIWTKAPDMDHAIHQIGRRAGVSSERLAACLSDRDYAKALLADYKKNAAADDVRSTPTFIINGEKATGAMGYEEFAKLIDAKL